MVRRRSDNRLDCLDRFCELGYGDREADTDEPVSDEPGVADFAPKDGHCTRAQEISVTSR
jgi:hypothetical protein